MKRCIATAVCAAALVPGGLAIKASTAVAQTKAQSWLQRHRGAPQQDDLAELKAENPEAYGIVKALLTKRSLGLLDPRHPTASFAAAPPQDSSPTPGAEAFEKIAEESGEKLKVAPLYASAPVAAHHDWLSWKPQQSALDDEAMVKNVLGAVAQMKGGSLRGSSSAPADDDSAPLMAPAAPAPIAAVAVEAPPQPQPQPQAPKENSYLKSIGLDAPARSQPAAPENSYLKGLNLDSAAPPDAARTASKPAVGLSAIKTKDDGANYLASFSWGDDAPAAPKAPQAASESAEVDAPASPSAADAAPAAAAAPVAPAAPKKKNALLAWLGGEKQPAAAPAAPAKEAQAPAKNPYIMDLN